MDNKTKYILGIIVVIAIIALFIFWPSAPEAKATYMKCHVHNQTNNWDEAYIQIFCYENSTEKKGYTELENATVLVNVTYENNTVVKYNLTTDKHGNAEIRNLSSGKYTVSARLVGDETHNTSTYTEKVEIKEYVAPSKTTSKTYTEREYETEYETYTVPGERYTYEYYWVYV